MKTIKKMLIERIANDDNKTKRIVQFIKESRSKSPNNNSTTNYPQNDDSSIETDALITQ